MITSGAINAVQEVLGSYGLFTHDDAEIQAMVITRVAGTTAMIEVLQSLLACSELNMDEMESETVDAIRKAELVIAEYL